MTRYRDGVAHRGESEPRCSACGLPSDDDVCAIVAQLRREHPEWSSRRCFDRAYLEACKAGAAGVEDS